MVKSQINGLAQVYNNSIADALKLLQSCARPSIEHFLPRKNLLQQVAIFVEDRTNQHSHIVLPRPGPQQHNLISSIVPHTSLVSLCQENCLQQL